jgi:hypothetical protein
MRRSRATCIVAASPWWNETEASLASVGKMTDFSVFHFPSYDAIDIAELAVAVEDAGFASLMLAECSRPSGG